jgi:integrase
LKNLLTTLLSHEKKATRMLIRFVFRPISSKNQGVLYVRITLNGERAKSDFSTFITIEAKKWDSKAQKIIPVTSALNRELDLVKESLWAAYQELKAKHSAVTAEMVKQHYLKGSQKMTIIEASQKCIEGAKNVSYRTLLNIKSNHNVLEAFLKQSKKMNFALENIDFQFVEDFKNFTKNSQKKTKEAQKSVEYLKRLCLLGIKNEWISKNPLAFYKVKKATSELLFLEKEHLEALEALPKTRLQQRHYDFFKFQLNTGMSYCDAFRAMTAGVKILQKNDIEFFTMKRQKTNEEFFVLVNENIKKYLLSGATPPKYNAYIFILHKLGSMAKLPFALTSHVGRKTFAMRKRNEEGFSSAAVALMLGHDESMTEKTYSKVNLERILREM